MDEQKYENLRKILDDNMMEHIKEIMVGAGIFGIVGLVIGGLYYGMIKTGVANANALKAVSELQKTKIEKSYILQEKDLNNNGIPEKFYEINGQKYFLEIDGKTLEDKIRRE